MGSADRRAKTDDLLELIDSVVSGHELQRTYEPRIIPTHPARNYAAASIMVDPGWPIALSIGLYVAPTFGSDGSAIDTLPEAVERDEATRQWSRDLVERFTPEDIERIKSSAHSTPGLLPDAVVTEVRVVLSDGNHDMTWEEFLEWVG